jgi:hypothetical protein
MHPVYVQEHSHSMQRGAPPPLLWPASMSGSVLSHQQTEEVAAAMSEALQQMEAVQEDNHILRSQVWIGRQSTWQAGNRRQLTCIRQPSRVDVVTHGTTHLSASML